MIARKLRIRNDYQEAKPTLELRLVDSTGVVMVKITDPSKRRDFDDINVGQVCRSDLHVSRGILHVWVGIGYHYL